MSLTIEETISQSKLLINFDPFIEIAIQLQKLPLLHQVTFFASCCERLLPIYILVSEEPGWGNISILTSIKNEIWKFTFDKIFYEEEINNLISRLGNVVIGGDNDDESYTLCDESALTEEAREIVRYFYFILKYILNSELKIFIDIFVIPIYIIYGRIDRFMDGDLQVDSPSQKIAKHRKCALEHQLIQTELQKQSFDLELLKLTSEPSNDFLSDFRDNACNNERSILGTLEEIRAMCKEEL